MTSKAVALLPVELIRIPLLEVRVEQAEQSLEGALDPGVRRGGEEQQVPLWVGCQLQDEFVAEVAWILLGAGSGDDAMSLVDNYKFRRVFQKVLTVAGQLEEVERGDDDRKVAVDRAAGWEGPFQCCQGRRGDDDRIEMKFLAELGRPLVGERWRTEDDEAMNLLAVPEFAGNEASLDCLPDTNIVGNQEADRVEAEGHEQGNELVGTWAYGDAAERAERSCTFAQEEARCLCQETDGFRIGEAGGVRRWEAGGL